MAQAKAPTTRAVDSLSANNEKQLAENQKIVQNDDGSVYIYTTNLNGSTRARRIDSAGDADHVARGGTVWYTVLLKQQAERDKPKAAPKKAAKKVNDDE